MQDFNSENSKGLDYDNYKMVDELVEIKYNN